MAIIGLDATSLSISGKGVSKYQYNLIKSLAKIDKKNCYYIFLNKKNIFPELPKQDNFHYAIIYIPNRIYWDIFQFSVTIKKYKVNIYHTTSDTLPVIGQARFILFLFEIPDYRIESVFQGGHSSLYTKTSYRYTKLFFPYSLSKAEVIITSSNSTKKDLIQKYGIEDKKIQVIYPACNEKFHPIYNEEQLFNIRKKYNAERGYILHISSADPRDNTPVVIRAYHKVWRELGGHKKLIIYGNRGPEQTSLNRLTAELNLEDNVKFVRRFLDREEARLAELYQAADVYVDPSLYEGFGFQVVEAMACGIPVVISNVTSLPEIVGEAGILVSPADIDGLSYALVRILTDSQFSQTMRQKSLERARLFSWEKTAKETLSVYDELLSTQRFNLQYAD